MQASIIAWFWTIIIMIVVFLILRIFWLWYWKIDKVVDLLENIDRNTRKKTIMTKTKQKEVLEGLNTMRSGIGQLVKNETPIYELISGAAITFAAFLLIIPGFLTDIVGFLLIVPFTRKFIIRSLSSKFKKVDVYENVIEGESEEDSYDKNNKGK